MTQPTPSNIPPFFLTHNSYIPTPQPHLILPPPFSEYCLTQWQPSDKEDLRRLAAHPKIVPFLGVTGPDDPNLEGRMNSLARFMGRDNPAWPFQVIRQTRLVKQWKDEDANSKPPVVGTIAIDRNRFRDLPVEQREVLAEKEKLLSDEQGNWMPTMILLDPDHGGKGLMTEVYKFALETWFLPALKPPPGSLAAGWESKNRASQALHERIGFKVVGQRPPEEDENGDEGYEIVVAVWQGAGEIEKKDTIYRDIPDWP